ncbi:hypothetical protein [Bacillus cereus group sp. BfR-BA-01380]|uniref:hypothetical protein n=1 Tax=Bacillus cereus group sp. BfR-BA-01380 TaxID=2920324 RepID=UPI001F595C9A|nr:hypothetical protein [Bacillus cereus group sp. BfR-BA-01380]
MDKKVGKTVAISAMAAALLGSSGYIVYDKGFKRTEKSAVKLASETEKKDDRITGNNNLQSMFPNVLADPNKPQDAKTNEPGKINLSDLLGNTKSPITPVTYNSNEAQVDKKEPVIKLDDRTAPPPQNVPNTNVPTPVVDPKPSVPDPKPIPDPDPKPKPEDPKPKPEDPKPKPEDPKPKPEDPKPKPVPDRPIISISPNTGDILVTWYENNQKYSTVFFNQFSSDLFGQSSTKQLNPDTLNNMVDNYSAPQEDLTLVSQTTANPGATGKANYKLTQNNLGQILQMDFSDNERLFYIRNQRNALNSLSDANMKEQELQKFLTKEKKQFINSLAEQVYRAALHEEKAWMDDPNKTEELGKALSKYYLVTSVLADIDDKLIERANERVKSIFNKIVDDKLKTMKIQPIPVPGQSVTTNDGQVTKQDSNEEKKQEEKMKGTKESEKQDSIDEVIKQVEDYLHSQSPNYEQALLLADQWIDQAKGEKQSQLIQYFTQAVEGLVGQVKDSNTPVENALQKANLLIQVNRVEKAVQDEMRNTWLMPLIFEANASKAMSVGNHYNAVLYMANSIRVKHPLERRARDELNTYATSLWNETEAAWDEINGKERWQDNAKEKVLPSYTLLAQLTDIDSTIGQIQGVGVFIDKASRKMEGIQLLNVASTEANKDDTNRLYNALHYYGQAAARGVVEKTGFTNVVNDLVAQAQQLENEDYGQALKTYQFLYATPGVKELGVHDLKKPIQYLGTFDAAKSKKKEGSNTSIEDLATAIALTNESMKLGYNNPVSTGFMKTVTDDMLQKGKEANDLNTAYKCYEFLTRTDYEFIPETTRAEALQKLNEIKERDKNQ